MAASWIYLKKAPRLWEGSSMILIMDSKDKPQEFQALVGLEFGRTANNLYNQMQVLKSYDMALSTVKLMRWEVSYYSSGRLRTNILYNDPPFLVIPDTNHVQLTGSFFHLTVKSSNTFELEMDNKDGFISSYKKPSLITKTRSVKPAISLPFIKQFHFGDTIRTSDFCFVIQKTDNTPDPGHPSELGFSLNTLKGFTDTFINGLKVEPTAQKGSVLRVTLKYFQPEMLLDFLNCLGTAYMNSQLATKNEASMRTVNFIDKQLNDISLQLNSAEMNMENYRKENKFFQLDAEAQQVLDNMKEIDEQKSQLLLKHKYYVYVQDYLNTRK